ncbi:HTH_Tnp_Tc3_2 domain-containing protein [Trichonephila clavipes]|nr:HTH_Tnp_Tc3_2 domain-containing protein [Trichonephila clavipes]
MALSGSLPKINFGVQAINKCHRGNHQRNIIDKGFRSRRPTHVPLLTSRHKALRLAWARQHRHWTVDDRKHIAFSDESFFQLNRVDVYGYEDNLMNPWTPQINRGLFKLEEAL